jgi:hypothetical protein
MRFNRIRKGLARRILAYAKRKFGGADRLGIRTADSLAGMTERKAETKKQILRFAQDDKKHGKICGIPPWTHRARSGWSTQIF